MADEEPRLMGRDEQIRLVTDLRVALRRASETKLDWLCDEIREALYQANIGREPENLGQITPLIMELLKRRMSTQGCPSKEEKQPTPAATAEEKPPSVQDLRRRIYDKAKSDKTWRFWGIYVDMCRLDTLWEAYRRAKANGGAPGVDGQTFKDIEQSGVEEFFESIQDEQRAGCDQACLHQIEGAPESCKLQALLEEWYRGRKCSFCRKSFTDINWVDHKPALLTPDLKTIEWKDVSPEMVDLILSTHAPVCWNCHIADTFRREHAEFVTDRRYAKNEPRRVSTSRISGNAGGAA